MNTPLLYMLHSGKLYGTERMALATADGLRGDFNACFFAPAGEALDEAYEYFVNKIPRYPQPTLSGMQTVLNELARSNPKAGVIKPEELIDGRFVRELQNSKFSDAFYK